MNSLDDNSGLRVDVANFVKSKFGEIMCVDQITSALHFQEPKSKNVKDSFENLFWLKKILQLIINLYNNYDSYKKIPMQFLSEESNNLMSLANIYKYDEASDSWICIGRPETSVVVDAVFNYVVCYMSFKMEEGNVIDVHVNRLCPFCDCIVAPDETRCVVCEASIKEVRQYSKKNKTKEIEMKSENEAEDERINNGEVGDIEDEYETKEGNVIEITRQCKTCKCLRSFDGVLDGEDWICEGCSSRNKWDQCEDEKIKGTIDHNNDDTSNNDDGQTNEREDLINQVKVIEERLEMTQKWKCSQCGLHNSYNVSVCEVCISSVEERGRWFCKHCTTWNEFIYSFCNVCSMKNDNEMFKYCQLCKEKRINVDDSFCDECVIRLTYESVNGVWKCRLKDCQEWTLDCKEYCKECGIWRYTSFETLKRGDTVKKREERGEVNVWRCMDCKGWNNEDKYVCGSWLCWRSRYGKQKCVKCGLFNDGKSKVCNGCHTTL